MNQLAPNPARSTRWSTRALSGSRRGVNERIWLEKSFQ
jgi:hypothetical protein